MCWPWMCYNVLHHTTADASICHSNFNWNLCHCGFSHLYISLSPKEELSSQRNADQQDPTSLAAAEGASLPSPAPQLPEQMKDQESKMDTVDEEWPSPFPRRAWFSETTNKIGKKSPSVSPSALLSLSVGAARARWHLGKPTRVWVLKLAVVPLVVRRPL